MKKWIRGTNAIVLSAAVIGLFILLTVALQSVKGFQLDLTANKKYTLTDQTLTTLKGLDEEVAVILFSYPGLDYYNREVSELLTEYSKRNGKVTFKEVDPKKQPSLAEQYQISEYGTVVFEKNGSTKMMTYNDLFGYSSDQTSFLFKGEEKFTQALLSLTSGETRNVYLVTGHGELTASHVSTLSSHLENENYTVQDLNLMKDGVIPEDADALFVLAPEQDISDEELALLEKYVDGDGKLLFSIGLSDSMDTWTNWNTLLGSLGVVNTEALAVEEQSSLSTDPLTIIPEYGIHEITTKLSDANQITILPIAIALDQDESNEVYTLTPILKTSLEGHGKINLKELMSKQISNDDIAKKEGDLAGPLDLAYAIEDAEGKPKAIVVGNGLFYQDTYIGQQGNKDFMLNSSAWLQEEENALTIRPREEAQQQQVYLSQGQGNSIFIFTVVVVPVLFLMAGGLVWWRRRKG